MKETKENIETTEPEKEKKTLTLRNSDLEALISSEGMGNFKQSPDLPIAFSFRLADLMGKLQSTIKAYMDQKQKLIGKYADRDKDGNLIQSASGVFAFTTKAQWFQKEFTDLLKLEFTLDCEKLQISVKDIPEKRHTVCPHCKKEIDQLSGIISSDDITAMKSIIEFQPE